MLFASSASMSEIEACLFALEIGRSGSRWLFKILEVLFDVAGMYGSTCHAIFFEGKTRKCQFPSYNWKPRGWYPLIYKLLHFSVGKWCTVTNPLLVGSQKFAPVKRFLSLRSLSLILHSRPQQLRLRLRVHSGRGCGYSCAPWDDRLPRNRDWA